MRGDIASKRGLDDALDTILQLLTRRRIPYMLMGGLALAVWGRVRATYDVDIAIGLASHQEEGLLLALQGADFLPSAPQAMLGHRLLVCRYLRTVRGLPIEVDLFLARGDYQQQALQRAGTIVLGRRRLRVISPEDLILYKVLADRPIDHADIQGILHEQRERLDRAYMTRWAKHLGVSQRLRTILEG